MTTIKQKHWIKQVSLGNNIAEITLMEQVVVEYLLLKYDNQTTLTYVKIGDVSGLENVEIEAEEVEIFQAVALGNMVYEYSDILLVYAGKQIIGQYALIGQSKEVNI